MENSEKNKLVDIGADSSAVDTTLRTPTVGQISKLMCNWSNLADKIRIQIKHNGTWL